MNIRTVFKKLRIKKKEHKDLHVARYFSSYVAVSEGKVVAVTDPRMRYCPLAGHLYKRIMPSRKSSIAPAKKAIKAAVEQKISRFGHFTGRREIDGEEIAVPYGASEMLMYAMKRGIIDAAVVVCDGAGTVVVNKPEIIQGIGARMNGLFYTSPVRKVVQKLENAGCNVVFDDASIDQIKGIERAADLGYKKIAVTINACMNENTGKIRKIEKEKKVSVVSLIICATGLDKEKVMALEKNSDLIWSCASREVRNIIGKRAIMQLSKAIPVFVLTRKGLNLTAGYSSNERLLKRLDLKKQYIICSENIKNDGKKIRMGNFTGFLNKAPLPVRSDKEPELLVK